MVYLFLIAATLGQMAAADIIDIVPERRPETTKFQVGSLVFPIFSHIPGIGSSYGVGFLDNNLFGTRSNLETVLTTGQMSTYVLGLTEVHLVQDRIVTSYYLYSTKIPFQVYERGSSSDPNGFFDSIDDEYGGSAEIDFNFWERRVQFNTQIGTSRLSYHVAGPDGTRYDNADRSEFGTFNPTLTVKFDFTDDNVDPRKGLKTQFIRDQTINFDGLHSRYWTWYAMSTAYIPMGTSSTWTFNYSRSGAVMDGQNQMSEAQLRSQMGLNCGSISDPTGQANCQQAETIRVQERFAENQYGTAGQLGGPMELRGFQLNRFHGSQTVFYGTEFRWNVDDKVEQFNYGFIKGTKSFVQIAPFYELGAAADPPTAIEKADLKSSYGVGFRFGFSGAIIRADVGFSNEGSQFTFFAGYPWDISPF